MHIPKEISSHTPSSTLHSIHRNQESFDLNEQQIDTKDRSTENISDDQQKGGDDELNAVWMTVCDLISLLEYA
jgi:hypothetical protein